METTSKTFWQTACELKIGPVPAPVYLVLAVIVAAATIFGPPTWLAALPS